MKGTTYLVGVVAWEVHRRRFVATSREEALALAEANWNENGAEDWSFKHCGTDGFEIVDEQEVQS